MIKNMTYAEDVWHLLNFGCHISVISETLKSNDRNEKVRNFLWLHHRSHS